MVHCQAPLSAKYPAALLSLQRLVLLLGLDSSTGTSSCTCIIFCECNRIQVKDVAELSVMNDIECVISKLWEILYIHRLLANLELAIVSLLFCYLFFCVFVQRVEAISNFNTNRAARPGYKTGQRLYFITVHSWGYVIFAYIFSLQRAGFFSLNPCSR